MKFQFAIFLSIFSTSYTLSATPDIVEETIGQLILSHDRKFSYSEGDNSFGIETLYREFESIYKNQITHLPVEDRIDFLWASMWHLGFDGHAMYEFQSLIAADCGQEFINRLEFYIRREAEFQRDKSKLYLTKKVLSGLQGIVQANAQIEKQ